MHDLTEPRPEWSTVSPAPPLPLFPCPAPGVLATGAQHEHVQVDMHSARKYRVPSGVAPQPPMALHTMGQKLCFWIPRMTVFELHNARKYRVGSRVPQQAHPMHPGDGQVFGSWGVALQTHTKGVSNVIQYAISL